MSNEPKVVERLVNWTEVIELILRFAAAFDDQDWGALRSCLTDVIDTDYSQFRGEPPSCVSADAYVESRRQSLSNLRTLHISTNHIVTIAGDTAECRSAYRIFRVDAQRAPGENRLDTAGRYEHGLVRTPDGWRINRIHQTVLIQEGNRLVHAGLSSKAPIINHT